jgi:hypothetical protein
MMKGLAIILLVLVQWAPAAQISIAMFPNPITSSVSIDASFLKRVRDAGYTHILLHAEPSGYENEWSNGVYQCSTNPALCSMKNNLYKNFLRIGEWNKQNGANLKVIVHLGLGNKWAAAYGIFDPLIKWHVFKDYTGTAQALKGFGLGFFLTASGIGPTANLVGKNLYPQRSPTGDSCPIYTDNPEYDKTISNHVKIILQAYRDAYLASTSSLSPTMDYIHLGFDENYIESGNSYGLSKMEKLCFGNSLEDLYEMNRQYFASLGISSDLQTCYDRWRYGTAPNPDDGKCTKWIATTDDNPTALTWRHKLLSDELDQQITALKSASASISGNPLSGAKFMVWGDVWDPQKAGGYFGFSQFLGDIASRFGQNLVMVPWQYSPFYQAPIEAGVDIDVKYELGTEIGGQIRGTFNTAGHYYDSKAALEAFTSKNIPTLFCSALRAGKGQVDPSTALQAYNYSTACKENSKCLGYVAGIYPKITDGAYDSTKGAYNQGAAYAILEMLPLAESRKMKGIKLNTGIGKVISRPGYFLAPGLFRYKAQSAINSMSPP